MVRTGGFCFAVVLTAVAAVGAAEVRAEASPLTRIDASAIVDGARDRLIIFGGYESFNTGPNNDVWELPLSGPPIWTKLLPTGGPPAGRNGHSAIYDPLRDRMIVFGGYGPNDVWALSLSGEPAWYRIDPAGPVPDARSYASAIYDPVRDRMIVFGGSGTQEYNDVWALALSGTPTWSLIEPPGTRPAGRSSHSAIYDRTRDRMVITGGLGLSDVWALPLNQASPWERIIAAGVSPLPRRGHAAVYDSTGDRMVLFGGVQNICMGDTWSLTLGAAPTWSQIVSSTPSPSSRNRFAGASDAKGERLVIFGGICGGWFNDTWVLPVRDPLSWSMIQPVDVPPAEIAAPVFLGDVTGIPSSIPLGHSFTLSATVRNDGVASDDGRIVVAFPSFTQPFDGGQVSSSSYGDAPGFRTHVAGSAIAGAVCEPLVASYLIAEYVDDAWTGFGGESQRFDLTVTPRLTGTFYVDVRSTMHAAGGGVCDPTNGLPANGEAGHVDQQGWAVRRFAVNVVPLPGPGDPPIRRRLHTAVHDSVRNRMLVFGGWVGVPSAETWELSLGETPVWSQLTPEEGPSARYGHTSIYDPVRDRMIVFGGFDTARRNDVWALSLSDPPTWTRLEPIAGPAPAPRRFHSAIYDPVRDQMVIFAGSSDSGDMDDAWGLKLGDAPQWTHLSYFTPRPPWRKYHSAVYDPVRDRMVVYGGAAGTSTLYDDLWAFPLTGPPNWSRLDRLDGPFPKARSGATLTYDPGRDRLWVVGGYSGAFENDAWTYQPASRTWEQTATWGTPMPGRELHTTIADPVADRLVVYGGTDSLGRLGDTWFLSRGGAPTWRMLGGVAPPPPPPDPIPTFTAAVSGVPLYISVGQRFDVTVSARNDGFPSDDGRISVAFPGFTDPADSQWVSMAATGGHPGAVETPAGGTLLSSSCQPVTAPYLVAEYADGNWQGFGFETHSVTFSVQPRSVGTFTFDVRATMHRAGDPACAVTGAVPDSGEGGHVDAQGWPVKRFTVTVLPPLTSSVPVFVSGGQPSPGRITLGQSLTMGFAVRNAGPASDDGKIVLGFPDFTAAGDSAYVSGWLSADLPGYRKLTAGSVLADSTCAPVIASYLTAEYADGDWQANGAETNWIQATVTPRMAGTFHVYVRSTMHTAGYGACAYVNGLPAAGTIVVTDQQGWSVKRYSITVDAPPSVVQPEFNRAINFSADTMIVGQPLYIDVRAINLGAASDDGRIVVGFTALTDPTDAAIVSRTSGGSAEYRELPVGAALLDSVCSPLTSSHLVVEYADTDWRWLGEEDHELALTVWPRTVGTFHVDIRTTMRTAGAGACAYVNAVPDTGDLHTNNGNTLVVDQQGWVVRRFTVTVLERPQPEPSFIGLVGIAPGVSITLGQTLALTVGVVNRGWESDDGRLSISFPSLTASGDSAYVSLINAPYSPNLSGYHEYPAGDAIDRSNCTWMTASHLAVEYRDRHWAGQESRTLMLHVTPRDTGSFAIRMRSTMHWVAGGPCDFVNAVPNGGEPDTDQQEWGVRVFTVRVGPPPPPTPTFLASVSGIPTAMYLGESIAITAVVQNTGGITHDGRISIAFPQLTGPDDAQWVSSPGSQDLPGFITRPAGSVLNTATCGSVAGGYLVSEYVDDNWGPGENNTVLVSVRPQVQGTFTIDVRATFSDPPGDAGACRYPNAVPPDGVAGFTDPQGFAVHRFVVEVAPPLGPPTVAWQPIDPGPAGPTARTGSTAVYVPTRQSLVIYGGAEPDYPVDVWSLPLSTPGAAWSQVTPGGPAPLRRTMHSMVYNQRDDQLVIFAGHYDGWIDDVLVMSMSGVPWWFPNPGLGTPPSARGGHTAIYDPVRHRMLVVGGYNGALLNDVWEYSPPGVGTWRQLSVEGMPMPPRALHAAVYDPVRDRVVVIGGDGGTFLNDVWAVNLSGSPTWERLLPGGVPPTGRREHTAIYDPIGDRVIVYGGFDGARRGDVFALTLGGSPAWSRLTSSTVSPASRIGHVAVYDAPRHRMVMFGGSVGTNAVSREVWALELDHPPPPLAVEPERVVLRLIGAQPNPARGELQIAFTLEDEQSARLELFDLGGRRVAARDVGGLGSGSHRVAIGGRGELRAGVYLVRLTQGGRALHAKACVVR